MDSRNDDLLETGISRVSGTWVSLPLIGAVWAVRNSATERRKGVVTPRTGTSICPGHNPKIKRFYQRKKDQTNTLVAIKAVAHKLARACYYVMRDQVSFQVEKAFG